MSDTSPTRGAVIELADERRAMREGHVFLDEKCLLLAGEILRELAHLDRLRRAYDPRYRAALAALQGAVLRHGLQGLQVAPPVDLSAATLTVTVRTLMGVRLQHAEWAAGAAVAAESVQPSPEASACRRAFQDVVAASAELAAVSGNLERLSLEYQRSVRRARALEDVMLPELDLAIRDIEGRLEELEREDAIWMRRGIGDPPGPGDGPLGSGSAG